MTAEAAILHDDPLSQCLLWLAADHGQSRTRDALTEGLPLRQGQLTPGMLPRAAERAGMRARMLRQPLVRINSRWLPCILILKGNRACVLTHLDSEAGLARVRVPELGMEEQSLTFADLQDDYAGVVVYCRPLLQLGDVAAENAASADSGHWFWSVIRGNRRIYRDVLVASLCINLFALAMPLFVMNVYDRVVPNQTTATLWVLAAGVGIVVIADLVLRMLRSWFVELAAGRADNRLSAKVMERVLGMRLEHAPASVGTLAGSIQGFESVRAFCGSMVVTALIDLPFFLLFLVIIVLIAPLMAVPVGLGALLLLLYALSVQQQMRRLADVSGQVSAQRSAGVIESLTCLPVLKSLNATGRMQRQWEQATRFLSGSSSRQRLLGASVSTGAAWVQQTVAVTMIIIGVYLVIDGQMSQGGLIAAYMLSSRAMAPVSQTAALLTQYHQAASALKMLDDVMATPQERSGHQQPVSGQQVRGDIEFCNLSFTYPGEARAALNGISMRIAAGEKVGVIGAAGSGKSTLEKLILGLYQPTEGSVLLDGVNTAQLDPAELRRGIGYLPQDLQLINGSVYDNVTLGVDNVDPRHLQQAVQVSGLSTLIGPQADGWSRQVGELGRSLSGGQQQTVALARALLSDAPVLLLDEPASAMDSMMEQHICRELKVYAQDKTLMLITHRTSLLQLVDRLIVLDKGRLIADGPKQQILEALAQGKLKRAAA
ncbi:type I secretion system permease/ATPase [Marinobacter fuscus]|uniref:Type I secretion system permease/ATPase n=1 Tax=Marinobacter fuscus TaxID=2109942 RepID=A0A2T1K3A4_9GAMM|nr:type I secretion system permease/ATPase [Marinobacter fuscus]PSF04654.1 type I secretion system permease/ATPase [Marinobacter fuscus]